MELKNNQDLEKNVQAAQDELLEIIEQLEWCGYECQGGPLEMNTAFIRLKEIAHRGAIAPAKLDRSRWEGCEYCLENNGIVTFEVPDEIEIPEDDVKMGWVEKPQYCPICGRPLTEEAWAELERKIGGDDGTADD